MLKHTAIVVCLVTGSALLAAPASLAAQQAADRFGGSARIQARQTPQEMAATDNLNKQQAEAATRQMAENTASREAFERARRERETTIARQEAERRSMIERQQREHDAAMERWRADAAACQAGDRTRCAQPVPPR
jgi:hypothetical protein